MCHIHPSDLVAHVSTAVGTTLFNDPLFQSRADLMHGRMEGRDIDDEGRVVGRHTELARATTVSGYVIALREPVQGGNGQQQIVAKMGRHGAGPFAAEVVLALKEHGVTHVMVYVPSVDKPEVRQCLGYSFRNGDEVEINKLIASLPAPHASDYTSDRHDQNRIPAAV